MKYRIIAFVFIMHSTKGFTQIQNPKIQHADVRQCEIMQIGLTDSATHVFFKFTNNNSGWICAGENFFIRDNQTGRKYKLINSLNIPICPSKQILDSANQVHYFSLSFQPIPKLTKEIDIIENPENGFNFYGVSLTPNNSRYDSINYVALLEETPVKEEGSFLKDGVSVYYFIHNGLEIAIYLTTDDTYGKYYQACISIDNYSNRRIDFLPENMTAKVLVIDKVNKVTPIKVLTYIEYIKKVNRRQTWNSFFVALGEASAANSAGYSAATTNSNSSGYVNSDGYTSGYFGNVYGSVSSNIRTYGNFTTTSTSYNYDATANYYAHQNASNNISNYNDLQYSIKGIITQGYLKSNTIYSNQRVNGFVNIEFKKADLVELTIPINNENVIFRWKTK